MKRQFCHVIFMLTGALLTVVALAQPVLEPTPVTSGPVSIQLPQGWKGSTKAGGITLIAAASPANDKDTTGEYPALITITASPGGGVLNGQVQQARFASEVQNYKVVESPTPVQIGGLQGVTFGGTFSQGTLVLRSRQYMVQKNNQLYTITVASLNSKWAAYQPLLEASVQTFTLHNPPATTVRPPSPPASPTPPPTPPRSPGRGTTRP